MIELFREPEMARVVQHQSILEAEGIATFVRNENPGNMRSRGRLRRCNAR